jgi:uncharacterized membrane protein YfcA
MDINWLDLPTLAGFSAVASLVVGLLQSWLGKIEGRFGKLATLALLLIASFAVAGIGIGFKYLPNNIVEVVYAIFVGGIAIYQIFYKAIYQQSIRGEKNV